MTTSFVSTKFVSNLYTYWCISFFYKWSGAITLSRPFTSASLDCLLLFCPLSEDSDPRSRLSSFRLLFRAELAFLPGDLLLLLDFWDEVFRGERESWAFLQMAMVKMYKMYNERIFHKLLHEVPNICTLIYMYYYHIYQILWRKKIK